MDTNSIRSILHDEPSGFLLRVTTFCAASALGRLAGALVYDVDMTYTMFVIGKTTNAVLIFAIIESAYRGWARE